MMTFVIFVLGLIFGSFNSVLIKRLSVYVETDFMDWQGLIFGRSKCLSCGKELKWYNLIPILSFVWQKGKCSQCKKNFSWFYPLIELVTALVFVLIFNFASGLEFIWQYLVVFLMVEIGIVIAGIDLQTKVVPLFLSVPLAVLGLGYGLFIADLELVTVLFGGVIGYVFFGLQYLVSKGKWVGLGDADIGLGLGFMFGSLVGIYTILQAYIIGTVVLLPFMVFDKTKKSMSWQVPFGPFLVSSMILSLMFGRFIVDWYLTKYIIF